MLSPFAYSSSLKSKILLCCATLTAIALLAMTAQAWLASSATFKPKLSSALTAEPLRPVKAMARLQPQIEKMRVTVTTTGFDPDELTHAAGQVMLAVDNRSGLGEVHLRLDREGGERLVNALVERGQLDWRGTVTLSAGNYILTEANHPNWSCRITVE